MKPEPMFSIAKYVCMWGPDPNIHRPKYKQGVYLRGHEKRRGMAVGFMEG